ncbi:MAG: RNA polymerase sigma factor [Gemmatimonadetes bacterium]|nr:RNA polymerase sigma factor [Gemmatimonadota bacterium]
MTITTDGRVPVEDWSAEYGAELERHVTRMLGNVEEARDVVQELWITALRTEPDSGEGSNIRAWLYRVATRRALDVLSARKRHAGLLDARSGELEPDRPPAPDSVFGALSSEAVEGIRGAVRSLPCKQRDAVWLRWIEAKDYETIAERLGCSPESARANVYQGMKKLRIQLAHVWREEVAV